MSAHPDTRRRGAGAGARSRPRAREFAVILDGHRAAFPDHWPIVRVARSLVAAGTCRQYEVVTEVRPRSKWRVKVCRRVDLVHVPTGALHRGIVGELTPIAPRALRGPKRGK